MITLEQLVQRAEDDLGSDLSTDGVEWKVSLYVKAHREIVERIVRSTLQSLDLHVDDKGEVYSPVPPPNPLPPPREVGAHWQGSGRGRRGEGGARRRR